MSDGWIIPKEFVVGDITPAQELIAVLCARNGIRTHAQAQVIFGEVYGRPDWQEIVDNCINALAPISYASDSSPPRDHPEWNHLRRRFNPDPEVLLPRQPGH